MEDGLRLFRAAGFQAPNGGRFGLTQYLKFPADPGVEITCLHDEQFATDVDDVLESLDMDLSDVLSSDSGIAISSEARLAADALWRQDRRLGAGFLLTHFRVGCRSRLGRKETMKTALVLVMLHSVAAAATVHYVDATSANPTPPYADWATAATVIQDAVDAAEAGDEVVVTNGIYAVGGRALVGTMTNRVAVNKPLLLRSVNGPTFTIIKGYQSSILGTGPGSVRCVYVASGAVLAGFTLTNGGSGWYAGDERVQSGGGLWCESATAVVSNCVIAGNSGDLRAGGVFGGTLRHCTIIGNKARLEGGGAWQTALNDCIVSSNSVYGYSYGTGGGVSSGTLSNCTLSGNFAGIGGGTASCALTQCALYDNSAIGDGGGAYVGTLNNCVLRGNSASTGTGGGAYAARLNNCELQGNSASKSGGGASECALNNCTVTGNWLARQDGSGGGAFSGTINNCILYFNTAPAGPNYDQATLNFCCTTPLPLSGQGNFDLDPQLASPSHLSSSSPCRGKGNALFASSADLDGEAWCTPPSIGCDEYIAGTITGSFSLILRVAFTNVAAGHPVSLSALIQGRVTGSLWDFGDGTTATNRPYVTHAWMQSGDYPVVLTAINESYPVGLSVTNWVHVAAPNIHYVAAAAASLPPYSSWATAATNIQDAIDVAGAGDDIVVSNGIYSAGGRVVYGAMTNRVAVTKPVTIRSVNGPASTIIQGAQVPGFWEDEPGSPGETAVRCAYLTSGARLYGFTLREGATRDWRGDQEHERNGGGAWCETASAVISNCVLEGNIAYNAGGGVYGGTLYHCILTNNQAYTGAGAASSALTDCLLTHNSALPGGANAGPGGGALSSLLDRCTVASNVANVGGGVAESRLIHCRLTNNASMNGGGGALSSSLDSCILAANHGPRGAGALECQMNNCTLTRNQGGSVSGGAGAGAHSSSLTNCTLAFNAVFNTTIPPGPAGQGAGAANCTLVNCISYFNEAANDSNYLDCRLDHCCTTPLPLAAGNIDAAPAFLDTSGDNWRLRPESPCVDAGLNTAVPGPVDLDDRPRVFGSGIDIGAYEYNPSVSGLFLAWLLEQGLPTDGSADQSDADGDGLNNWQEWRCGTDPADTMSVLRLLSVETTPSGRSITWQSVEGRLYFVERARNLSSQSAFLPIAINLPGQAGAFTYTDTEEAEDGPFFYRVGVE